MQGKHDVLKSCTWGVCKLCTWAGRTHVRKQLSEHRRSAGTHCGDIGWGAYEGQNGAKMQLGVEVVCGVIVVDRLPSGAFSSHLKGVWYLRSVQEVIRGVYDDLASVCLKDFLGSKYPLLRFGDMVAMV